MATASRPRQPKLRLSCDGCFLAKVKCSKQRPICTRCLSVGLDCRYSPSIRAGKTKSDSNVVTNIPAMLNVCLPEPDMSIYPQAQHSAELYRLETGWSTTTEGPSRSHSMPFNLSMMEMESQGHIGPISAPASDLYAPPTPWTTQPDMSPGQYSEATFSSPMSHAHTHSHARSLSFDLGITNGITPVSTWDVTQADSTTTLSYTTTTTTTAPPLHTDPTYFAPPIPTPTFRPSSVQSARRPSAGGGGGGGGSCTCFTVCLQSLQALHNASSPACPPLNIVFNLNRKAVQGCAAMLACQRCMRRSGIHTAAMLLATVIGKITSFYKTASRAYFDSFHNGNGGHMTSAGSTPASTSTGPTSPSSASMASGSLGGGGCIDDGGTGLGVSIDNYRIASDDSKWLELEILARELRKLEEVYARFCDVCSDPEDDSMQDVGQAMIGYLGQNLDDTLGVVRYRRGDMG